MTSTLTIILIIHPRYHFVGLSQMLVEEHSDLFAALAKAQHAADPKEAYSKLAAETLPLHFTNLEKLLATTAGPYFRCRMHRIYNIPDGHLIIHLVCS
jgi:hypothetical protein